MAVIGLLMNLDFAGGASVDTAVKHLSLQAVQAGSPDRLAEIQVRSRQPEQMELRPLNPDQVQHEGR